MSLTTEQRLAAALALVLHDAHPTYPNTSGPYGGIGGQALTSWCMINEPYPGYDWAAADLPSTPLREFLQQNPDFDLDAAKEELKKELLEMLK